MPAAWDNVGGHQSRAEDFYRPDHSTDLRGHRPSWSRGRSNPAGRRHGLASSSSASARLAGCRRSRVSRHARRATRRRAANVRSYARNRPRALAAAVGLRQCRYRDHELSVFSQRGASPRAELVDPVRNSHVFEIAEMRRARRVSRAHSVDPARMMPDADRPDRRMAQRIPGGLRGLADWLRRTSTRRPADCDGGDLVIVAGRPSMGKTTLAVNMAEYAALKSRT